MPKYEFQKDIIKEGKVKLKSKIPVILSPCVGAGKTVMANEMFKTYPKVLVLAHNQDVLRSQFMEATCLHRSDVFLIKRSKDFNRNIRSLKKGVIITLPGTIKDVKNLGHFDLLVVDEAHQYYDASMVRRIIKRIPMANHLLPTATPFNLRNRGFHEITFCLDRAMDVGIMSNASLEVMASTYDYDLTDYTEDDHLKKGTKITKKATYQTMNRVIKALLNNIVLDKTIIVTTNIKQANYTSCYLNDIKIKNFISHSENDISSSQIDAFKRSKDTNILIVVGRARLGFDMPSLVNLVDLSGTLNPCLIYQMLGRVTRRHPLAKKKRFIKLTPYRLHEYTYAVMCLVAGLCYEEFFKKYSINSYTKIKLPKKILDEDFDSDDSDDVDFENLDPKTKDISNPNPDSEARFEDDESEEEGNKIRILDLAKTCDILKKYELKKKSALATTAYITLAEIRRKLSGNWQSYMAGYPALLDYVKGLGVTSVKEWQEKDLKSYAYATRHKIKDTTFPVLVARKLGWKVLQKWSHETARKEAAKYKSLSEWNKKSAGSYVYALVNKIHLKIAKELGWKPRKMKLPDKTIWTYALAKKEAAKWQSLTEWQNQSPSYSWAKKNKLQHKIATDLGWKLPIRWTHETTRKEATKYKSLSEWNKKSAGSYRYAVVNKIHRIIAKKLGWQ